MIQMISGKIVYLLTLNAILATYPQMWISGNINNVGISSNVDKREMLVQSTYCHLTICSNNGPIMPRYINVLLYLAKQLRLVNAWDILQRNIYIIVWHDYCGTNNPSTYIWGYEHCKLKLQKLAVVCGLNRSRTIDLIRSLKCDTLTIQLYAWHSFEYCTENKYILHLGTTTQVLEYMHICTQGNT